MRLDEGAVRLDRHVGLGRRLGGRGCINDWKGTTFQTHIAWAFANGITDGCFVDLYCYGNAGDPRARWRCSSIGRWTCRRPTRTSSTTTTALTGEASINRLAAAGITGGCGARRYCPNDNVTRGQMASFLVRALDLPPAVDPDHFRDDNGSTHEADIDSLFEAGITGGCGADLYCPSDRVTRGQMAAFLYRAFADYHRRD